MSFPNTKNGMPIVLLTLVIFLLLPVTLHALETVVLTDDQGEYKLGRYVEVFEDKNREFTIEDVSSEEFDDRFVLNKTDILNYGHSTSVFWVRLKLKNMAISEDDWLLEIDFPLLKKITMYLLHPNGLYTEQHSGVSVNENNRLIKHRKPIFPLYLKKDQEYTLFLEVFPGISDMLLPISIMNKDILFIKYDTETLLHGLYFGIIIVMIIYNLLFFFYKRYQLPLLYNV